MRPINEVIIHCTATRPEWMKDSTTAAKVAEIKRWHTEDRGWRDIGYHFLIDRDGTVAKGRPVSQTGAHVRGHNTGTIGIALIGGHGSSAQDFFSDHFTAKQDEALRRQLKTLQSIYGDIRITGHNSHAAKGCPGFVVSEWLNAHKAPEIPASMRVQRTFWALVMDFLKGLKR